MKSDCYRAFRVTRFDSTGSPDNFNPGAAEGGIATRFNR
jgi:hypothetical protein